MPDRSPDPTPDHSNDSSDPPLQRPNDTSNNTSAGLLLVSTPIGNLGDMTTRAVAALRDASFVLCEDSRVTARLLAAFGIATRLVSLHEYNEDGRIPATLAALREGQRIAIVSDAGTPVLSDPGYRLVRAAIAEGLPVSAIPGPNAATMALILSGLPPLPFLMLGFPAPKQAARRTAFAKLRNTERAGLAATLIWYEAPHRLAETLADMAAAFGDRPAAVARELTKKFEEVRRGTLPELAAHYAATEARGEITVAVGPAPAETVSVDDLDELLRRAVAAGSVKDAVARVVAETGLPRRTVYARALEIAAKNTGRPNTGEAQD